MPEAGSVCVHACVGGKVSSFPGPRRILGIADPSCRLFALYLRLYLLPNGRGRAGEVLLDQSIISVSSPG